MDERDYDAELQRINDSIFGSSVSPTAEWQAQAFLEPNWVVYVHGYKTAADALVDQVIEGLQPVDFYVYPAMFLYRHYLELHLKYTLLGLQRLHGEEASIPKTHDLRVLWKEVRSRLEQEWPEDSANDLFDAVGDRIEEFMRLDNGSFAFRYPVDTKLSPSFKDLMPTDGSHLTLNLQQAKEVVQGLAHVLNGASEIVTVHVQYMEEMEAEFRSEMGYQ